ncbi:MAG: hypothetical protein WC026_16135 [Hyphomicrobium sp.]|uniref:hypothetical protein n=1 Tax=Hyphomicrobium sp. TaxID=82 RepID=UPI00356B425E
MAVSATLNAGASVSQTRTAVAGVAPSWSKAINKTLSFANGTGANQADIVYLAERTVASATNDDIDLAGVLTDAFGATITAAELVALIVVNEPLSGVANTTNLTLGGATAFVPGFSAALWPISPGGVFEIASPGAAGLATITATTADILRVSNSSGASATYQILILARSA